MAKRNAPAINVRFSNRAQIERIKKAAKILGQSANTFIERHSASAAERVIRENQSAKEPELSQTA